MRRQCAILVTTFLYISHTSNSDITRTEVRRKGEYTLVIICKVLIRGYVIHVTCTWFIKHRGRGVTNGHMIIKVCNMLIGVWESGVEQVPYHTLVIKGRCRMGDCANTQFHNQDIMKPTSVAYQYIRDRPVLNT